MTRNSPGLTIERRVAGSNFVLVSSKFLTAVFALALWLGATQHCNLEAAGLSADHTDGAAGSGCCAGSDYDCAADGCESVENGAYRNASDDVTVKVPAFYCCQCLVGLKLELRPAEIVVNFPRRTILARPLDWVPTWQFVQRAARSPRAPSLIA